MACAESAPGSDVEGSKRQLGLVRGAAEGAGHASGGARYASAALRRVAREESGRSGASVGFIPGALWAVVRVAACMRACRGHSDGQAVGETRLYAFR